MDKRIIYRYQSGCTQLSEKKKDYFCPKCDFTSSRVNVVICHMKHHGKDTNLSIKKSNALTIKKKKIEKSAQGSTDFTGNVNSKLKPTKRKSWKKNERSAAKSSSDPKLKDSLLADWSDDDETESINQSEDLHPKETKNDSINKSNNLTLETSHEKKVVSSDTDTTYLKNIEELFDKSFEEIQKNIRIIFTKKVAFNQSPVVDDGPSVPSLQDNLRQSLNFDSVDLYQCSMTPDCTYLQKQTPCYQMHKHILEIAKHIAPESLEHFHLGQSLKDVSSQKSPLHVHTKSPLKNDTYKHEEPEDDSDNKHVEPDVSEHFDFERNQKENETSLHEATQAILRSPLKNDNSLINGETMPSQADVSKEVETQDLQIGDQSLLKLGKYKLNKNWSFGFKKHYIQNHEVNNMVDPQDKNNDQTDLKLSSSPDSKPEQSENVFCSKDIQGTNDSGVKMSEKPALDRNLETTEFTTCQESPVSLSVQPMECQSVQNEVQEKTTRTEQLHDEKLPKSPAVSPLVTHATNSKVLKRSICNERPIKGKLAKYQANHQNTTPSDKKKPGIFVEKITNKNNSGNGLPNQNGRVILMNGKDNDTQYSSNLNKIVTTYNSKKRITVSQYNRDYVSKLDPKTPKFTKIVVGQNSARPSCRSSEIQPKESEMITQNIISTKGTILTPISCQQAQTFVAQKSKITLGKSTLKDYKPYKFKDLVKNKKFEYKFEILTEANKPTNYQIELDANDMEKLDESILQIKTDSL